MFISDLDSYHIQVPDPKSYTFHKNQVFPDNATNPRNKGYINIKTVKKTKSKHIHYLSDFYYQTKGTDNTTTRNCKSRCLILYKKDNSYLNTKSSIDTKLHKPCLFHTNKESSY